MIWTILKVLVTLFSVLLLVFFLGPRVKIDEAIRVDAPTADLDLYLRQQENRFNDIRPGCEKKIIWADSTARLPTPISIIYFHGFSASRQESVPLTDIVAKRLNANLYYTRLAGHGRDGQALAEASVNDWLQDAVEAYQIGCQLGKDVVVVGMSTGGTLATWLAAEKASDPRLKAVILLSPNFGPAAPAAELLLWPWAEAMLPYAFGEFRSWVPENAAHGRYWTTHYPARALLPMMGLIKLVRDKPLAPLKTPFQFIYHRDDQVVDHRKSATAFRSLGSRLKEQVLIDSCGDPSAHVIAGDILSPGTTGPVADDMERFIRTVTSSSRSVD